MQKFILKGAEYQSSLLYQEQVASGCAAAAEIQSHQSPPYPQSWIISLEEPNVSPPFATTKIAASANKTPRNYSIKK